MRIPIATAVLLFLAYTAFLSFGPKPGVVKTQSAAQENQYVLERFLRSPDTAKVVFVGSSMTRRLDFRDFDPCVYNMALDGDSFLTGLTAIREAGKIPRMIFVEINVPERGVGRELIAKASGMLPRLSPVFHTENVPVNRLFSFLYQLRQEKPESKVSENAFRIAFETRRKGYDNLVAADLLDSNFSQLERLAREMQGRGAQVIFFEIPMHPDMEQSPRAEQIRAAFKRTLPAGRFLSYQDLSRNTTIKTRDGIHLHADEARDVVRNLESSFAGACS